MLVIYWSQESTVDEAFTLSITPQLDIKLSLTNSAKITLERAPEYVMLALAQQVL